MTDPVFIKMRQKKHFVFRELVIFMALTVISKTFACFFLPSFVIVCCCMTFLLLTRGPIILLAAQVEHMKCFQLVSNASYDFEYICFKKC